MKRANKNFYFHPSIFLGFVLGAIILTWPVFINMGDALPLGSESTISVPLFNLWSLGWNVDRIQHGFQNYWQAPIFFPIENTFAFSEPQPLTGLLAYPFWNISPALAYNFVLLLFIALNGWTVFHFLEKRFTSIPPALVAGFIGQVLPFFAHERGVLQLQPFFGMVWAVGALWDLIDQSFKWRNSVILGLTVALVFMVSEYFGLILLVVFFILIAVRARKLIRTEVIKGVLAAAAVTLIIAGPMLISQIRILDDIGLSRSTRSVLGNSASIRDYFSPSETIWISSIVKPEGKQLYPGGILFAAAVVGVLIGWFKKDTKIWMLFFVVSAVVVVLLSLGLNLSIWGWQPFQIIRDSIPGFQIFRSPFRFVVWFQIVLTLMAGITLDWLWNRRKWTTFLLGILIIIEVFPLPVRMAPIPQRLDLSMVDGPTIFLPYVDGTKPVDYENTVEWMYQSLSHDVQLVNGYSGYFPKQNSEFKSIMAEFPSDTSIKTLKNLEVEFVIVKTDWVDLNRERKIKTFIEHGFIYLFSTIDEEYYVYSIR